MTPTVASLRALSTLSKFTDPELSILLGVAEVTRLLPNQVLCHQGAPGASCFLLVDGELDISHASDGVESSLGVARPGAFIGQISLVDHGLRSATVRARVDSVLLELSRATFDLMLRARSPVALHFQELIAIAGIRQHRAAIARLNALAAREPDAARRESMMQIIRAASGEWGISLDEVDAVTVVEPELPRVRPR
jgi:CRP-like cAMP-binding protein